MNNTTAHHLSSAEPKAGAPQKMEPPKGLVHEPKDIQVTTEWLRNTGGEHYDEPIYAVRDFLHNSRMIGAELNASNVNVDLQTAAHSSSAAKVGLPALAACNHRLQSTCVKTRSQREGASLCSIEALITLCLQGLVFSIEDDGAGLSCSDMRRAMDLRPKQRAADSPPQVSHFGEGMKVAAQSLVQPDGFVIFFSNKQGERTVVVLDTGSDGQGQYYMMWLPDGMTSTQYSPAQGLHANLDLCARYTDAGLPSPQDAVINKICKSTGKRSIAGNPRSPYDNVLELLKVRCRSFAGCTCT